jgi:hypothetical protein
MYLKYCQLLHEQWRKGKLDKDDKLNELFDLDFCPEPYFTLKEGKNPLFMLLTNPGSGMDFQRRRNSGPDYSSFSQILPTVYLSEKFRKGRGSNAAYRRLIKSIAFADYLGYDSIVNIETIPFHSSKLPKNKALNAINFSSVLTEYHQHLKKYLSDKPVLIVSACSSSKSISKEVILKSDWLKFQIELAGIQLSSLTMRALTKKKEKVTSALFKGGNKYVVLMMGSNNLPSID